MTEVTLNLLAIGIELGVPVLLLLGCMLAPDKRLIFSTALVATSPILLLYIFIAISHGISPAQTNFAFDAMWLMSFAPYMFFLTLGLLAGLIRHKVAMRAKPSAAA
jgi:hypothetical protein